MSIFNLPDLGEGLAEAEIREWYVKEGDSVHKEQPLLAVETAKALVDIPSPQDGVIAKLYGQVGAIIQTGQPLLAFVSDAGTVVGELEVKQQILQEKATGVTATSNANTTTKLKAAPAVRALAKALQVDLNHVTATGPQGSITLNDVQQAAKSSGHAAAPTPAAAAITLSAPEPLHGARRSMAIHMANAHRTIVPVTIMDNADIQPWAGKEDFSIRMIRAITAACQAEPTLNAHFDGASLSRQLFTEINLGLAVDSKEGLYVPVLKNIAQQTPAILRQQIDKFKQCAQQGNFALHDLQGATITLSNFGTIAGRYANPMIPPPTVAILGVGKSSEQPVAVTGQLVIHRLLPLSLTFDHRAVTGGEAARFLAVIIENLQKTT